MDNNANMASRYEHEIPEGYEARIEGNKVIIELKENEDERMLKLCIWFLDQSQRYYAEDSPIKECIAWLEKQGLQNLANSEKTCKVEPKFKVGDKIKYAGGPDHCAEKIIAIRNDAYYFSEVVSLPFIEQDKWELVGQKPADKIEQNPAWSEEDEKMVGCIRVIIEKYAFSQSAVDVNGDLCEREFIEPDEWLRTLKDRCTWKPSDEQMEYLAKAITTLGNEGDNKTSAILCELRTDLKKLK